MDTGDIKALINNLFNSPSESHKPILKKRKLACGFEIPLTIEATEITIIIGFDNHFPYHKPYYFIDTPNLYGTVPHIEKDGFVCYIKEDYVFFDSTNPAGIIKESFELVEKLLLDGLQGANRIDFVNEFESYWVQRENVIPILCNVSSSSEVKKIHIGKNGDTIFLFDDSREALKIPVRIKKGEWTNFNAVYVPLENVTDARPLLFSPIDTVGQLNSLIAHHISAGNFKKLHSILGGTCRRDEYVVFSFRQPNGSGDAYFVIHFSGIKHGPHPLLNPDSACIVKPISCIRVDKNYLTARGGSGLTLPNYNGLIIGCGSLGGYIIEELTRNSLCKLTLIDSDALSFDNTYRHVCGISYAGINKAKALKSKLEASYPHAEINAVETTIENALAKKQISILDFDFIIVATGNVTINTFLNELMHKKYKEIPTLYTWIEPYGIGGHCLVTNTGTAGCYHCLYDNPDSYNIASFASKSQPKPFTKSISGCGSLYTPFGSMDAAQTALLTVRALIQVLEKKETSSFISSWKGNPELFIKEGFITSPRFSQTEEMLRENRKLFVSKHCNICYRQDVISEER